MSQADEAARQLVFDVCHEIGNLVAAIRLQAHLLDEDLGAVGLARAGLEIEGLGARTGSLLSLVRPLLSGVNPAAKCSPPGVLNGVEDLLRDVGLRGVELVVDIEAGVRDIPLDHYVLHALVSFLAAHALELLGSKGSLAIGARASGDLVEVFVRDSASSDPSVDDWKVDGRRGRGLAASIADCLLRPVGGHCEVVRRDDRTHISLFARPC